MTFIVKYILYNNKILYESLIASYKKSEKRFSFRNIEQLIS
jgi:hypothetical protein